MAESLVEAANQSTIHVLREELAKFLPANTIPALVAVPNYREVTELGILVLCLQEE